MFMLEIWLNAHVQHLKREEELYGCMTAEMKRVADEIKAHERGN